MFSSRSHIFLIVLSVLVSPKINNVGVGGSGHVQKSQNHENKGFGPLNNEIRILLYQDEAEKSIKPLKGII